MADKVSGLRVEITTVGADKLAKDLADLRGSLQAVRKEYGLSTKQLGGLVRNKREVARESLNETAAAAQVAKARKKVVDVTKELRVQNSLETQEIRKLKLEVDRLTQDIRNQEAAYRSLALEQKKATAAKKEATAAEAQASAAARRNRKMLDETAKGQKQLRDEQDKARKDYQNWWTRSLNEQEKATKSLTVAKKEAANAVKTFSDGIAGIVKRAFAAGAVFIVFGKAIQTIKNQFRVISEFEKAEQQLQFISGSAYLARKEMEYLRDVSQELKQVTLAIAPQYAKMAYAFRQAGISGEVARKTFEGVSAAATVFGLSGAEAEGIFRAFVQVASKGKVQAEELHQISERLPGTFGMVAKAMNLTTGELFKLLETGKVGTEAIEMMADQLLDNFKDAAGEVDTLTTSVANLTNQWNELLNSDTAGGVFKKVTDSIANAIWALNVSLDAVFDKEIAMRIRANDLTKRYGSSWRDEGFKPSFSAFTGVAERSKISQDIVLAREYFAEQARLQAEASAKTLAEAKSFAEERVNVIMSMNREVLRETGKGYLSEEEQIRATAKERLEVLQDASTKLKDFTLANLLTLTPQALADARAQQAELLSLMELVNSTRDRLLNESADRAKGMFASMKADFARSQMDEIEILKDATDAKIQEINRLVSIGGASRGDADSLIGRLTAARDAEIEAIGRQPIDEAIAGFQVMQDAFAQSQMNEVELMRVATDAKIAQAQRFADQGADAEAVIRYMYDLEQAYQRDVAAFKAAQEEKQRLAALASDAIYQFTLVIGKGIEDGLINAAKNGKTAFKDMANFILAELQRVIIRIGILQPFYAMLGGVLPGGAGAAFSSMGMRGMSTGGFIPPGGVALTGENGPEIISGPAVVTSTENSRYKLKNAGGGSTNNHYTINVDQRGALVEVGAMRQLEQYVRSIDGNIERRAVGAVQNARQRNPQFMMR